MIAGTDSGQERAGLREVPEDQAQTVSVSASVTDEQALLTASTDLVPMLPAPPIRVLPPKPEAAPAVQDSRTHQRVNPSDDMAAMTFAPATAPPIDRATAPTVTEGTTLRWVAVERANVRSGASKTAPVTARIDQGEAVAVLWTDPSGWARVRIEGDGIDGYVYESLLTDVNPQFQ